MTEKLSQAQMLEIYDLVTPHLEAIEGLFKKPVITLLVRSPELKDGDLLLTQEDDASAALSAIKRLVDRGPTLQKGEKPVDIRHVI